MDALRSRGLAAAALTLLGVCATVNAQEQPPQYFEERFSALRAKVAQNRMHESPEILDFIEQWSPNITDCVADDKDATHTKVPLDGIQYEYVAIATGDDERKHCFVILKPFNRALSADEGRDFLAAREMASIPKTLDPTWGLKEKLQRQRDGERHLKELIKVISESNPTPYNAAQIAEKGVQSVGNLSDITDCSALDSGKLDELSSFGEADVTYARQIYSDFWYWHVIDLNGRRCVYVIAPIKRGLTDIEGRAIINGQSLDLGESQEMIDSEKAEDLRELAKLRS